VVELNDTIVALATPPGRSGIGVIRLSGHGSLRILRRLIRSDDYEPTPNLLVLKSLIDPQTNSILDEALVCYFKAPHSFTGEDVVELNCHGSPILLRAVIDATLTLDARMARPGEFSLRAVANGRMQLSQAEAIRDLIDAQTDAAVQLATRQLKGEISHALQPLKEELLAIIVRLESSLEFVEDDLPQLEQERMLDLLRRLRSTFQQMASTFQRGKLLRDGLRITLIGRPNTGKSSLFNRLLGRSRAIVHDVPGTTRDTITELVGLNGVPTVLTDTAGLRVSPDRVEAIGVDRTKREAADSDLLIVVLDGSVPLKDEDMVVLSEVVNRRHLIALNKSDVDAFPASRPADGFLNETNPSSVVTVSAKDGSGIDCLRAAMLEPFMNGELSADALMITNARHHDLLLRAIEAVTSSESLLHEHASEELVLVGLHDALRYLGEITGETTSDEILGQIFSTFCIGK
jgi:tRNA modification GTPase